MSIARNTPDYGQAMMDSRMSNSTPRFLLHLLPQLLAFYAALPQTYLNSSSLVLLATCDSNSSPAFSSLNTQPSTPLIPRHE